MHMPTEIHKGISLQHISIELFILPYLSFLFSSLSVSFFLSFLTTCTFFFGQFCPSKEGFSICNFGMAQILQSTKRKLENNIYIHANSSICSRSASFKIKKMYQTRENLFGSSNSVLDVPPVETHAAPGLLLLPYSSFAILDSFLLLLFPLLHNVYSFLFRLC